MVFFSGMFLPLPACSWLLSLAVARTEASLDNPVFFPNERCAITVPQPSGAFVVHSIELMDFPGGAARNEREPAWKVYLEQLVWI
jgi:hypothetical protein